MAGKFEAPRGRRPSTGTALPQHTPTPAPRPASAQPIRRRRRRRRPNLRLPALVLLLLTVAALVLTLTMCRSEEDSTPDTPSTSEQTEPEETVPQVVASATVGAMGDLLMHKPIFDDHDQYNAVIQQADGSYDFSSIFQYVSEYTSGLDYTAANLETTLAGSELGFPYSGYPRFNCPDSLVDSVKAAGFDMLLTANNHSYDTTLPGYKRTLEVIRGKGLETLGTMRSAKEPKYTIQDINGIQIGMIAYTYASYATDEGRPSLNDLYPVEETGICNYFTYDNLDGFYTELSGHLDAMETAGAEATILYIHWGKEYELTQNQQQSEMAQSLCDLGVDVIIGGHPHVVQPIELLTSTTDPGHKTVCLYSLGNAVSNQRLGSISSISTAHTEDGLLFSVTFSKYSDGSVYLTGVDALPTWVNKYRNGDGKDVYNILPLDDSRRDQWQSLYGLTDDMLSAAQGSYQRTMDIVGQGLSACRDYLSQAKQARETQS